MRSRCLAGCAGLATAGASAAFRHFKSQIYYSLIPSKLIQEDERQQPDLHPHLPFAENKVIKPKITNVLGIQQDPRVFQIYFLI
ncbi:hypothetical protein ACFQU1_02025 [Chelatococcus sp. GCM10030263]|uniref:hypothetical protein n=1 Tax=Chelatococcus sp. GCM10030263 TaxID=3273387 RepID=UPI00360812AE